jgi:hypothetical protein
MVIKPIRTEDDHAEAVARIEELFAARPGTPQFDELDVLATLRVVPQGDQEIVQKGNRAERRLQVMSPSPMVPKHSPILEPGNRVLDAGTTAPVPPPSVIPDDAITSKSRGDELCDTSVAAIGEHPSVVLTPGLHR